MDKRLIDRLLTIASLVLVITGAVFLGISIWGESKDTAPLAAALGCILLSNLFNIIRQLRNKEK